MLAATFFLVARHVENFEPTPVTFVAEREDAARNLPAEDEKRYKIPCSLEGKENQDWGLGEALWMTLRYHVPIVSLAVVEKCIPKDEKLHFARYAPFDWLEARDWFGAMAILNYILWPLFIPFLIRRFWRGERLG